MSARPAPDTDAAMVLGMASTAMPFADTSQAEAERWLRILRLQGEAGAALQALGVSEAPLEGPGAVDDAEEPAAEVGDPVARVGDAAAAAAKSRQEECFTTIDVLEAVIDVYGNDFNLVLRAHGTDRQEVLERLHPMAA